MKIPTVDELYADTDPIYLQGIIIGLKVGIIIGSIAGFIIALIIITKV